MKLGKDSLFMAGVCVAAGVTAASLWLRIEHAFAAGGMWRDEANTIGLATLPSLGVVWSNLQYDSFPIFWLLVVRTFAGFVGPMADVSFRWFGLFIGSCLLVALWLVGKRFKHNFPVISLALLGANASVIQWGDSIRAHGFGVLMAALVPSAIWMFVENRSLARWGVFLVVSLGAVHASFYNSVTLAAFGIGGAVVCFRRKDIRASAAILLCGLLSAVTLIPYAGTIRNASTWNFLVRIPNFDLAWFGMKLNEAVSGGGITMFFWVASLGIALCAGVLAQVRPKWFTVSESQRDAALFATVSLIVGVPLYYAFLKVLSYLTQPWYYLTLLLLVAVNVDIVIGSITNGRVARWICLAAAGAILVCTFGSVRDRVATRYTNIDQIASEIEKECAKEDFVLVNSWHNGVSFERYFDGPARWSTLPSIGFHRFHRYDILKERMTERDQRQVVQPILDDIAEALKTGNQIYLVGGLRFLQQGETPVVLPPAPESMLKWNEAAYCEQWSMMVAAFLQQHALKAEVRITPQERGVSHYENLPLLVISGWRE